MDARSAIWMNNVNRISGLEEVEMTDRNEWEILPPFGQLRFSKSLRLINMPQDWFEAEVAAKDGCLFPCLIELDLSGCPRLKEFPSLPSKLKRLKIYEIEWTTLNFCSN
ncbi:hypothetical protein IEQ34_022920 [Dendrobium chrysotoxum]|uniref:Disease resistance protein n=1 Tax=Dendrobium chrysotoxum TaxID=161865 RepID=A0AAV7G0D5_DENCH|nr:hypothetical protein IEQ34_022920 [Dendrobium chrysotoxum]